MTGLRAWGSEDLDDAAYFEPDPERHDPHTELPGFAFAEADFSRTLAAQDGLAGDSIWLRADLDVEAFCDDWEDW